MSDFNTALEIFEREQEPYLLNNKFTKSNLERLIIAKCKTYKFRLKGEEKAELFEKLRKQVILFVEDFVKNKICERRRVLKGGVRK